MAPVSGKKSVSKSKKSAERQQPAANRQQSPPTTRTRSGGKREVTSMKNHAAQSNKKPSTSNKKGNSSKEKTPSSKKQKVSTSQKKATKDDVSEKKEKSPNKSVTPAKKEGKSASVSKKKSSEQPPESPKKVQEEPPKEPSPPKQQKQIPLNEQIGKSQNKLEQVLPVAEIKPDEPNNQQDQPALDKTAALPQTPKPAQNKEDEKVEDEQSEQSQEPQERILTDDYIPKQTVDPEEYQHLRDWICDNRTMQIEFISDGVDVPEVWNLRTASYRFSQVAYLNLMKVTETEIRTIGLLCPRLQILELQCQITQKMAKTFAQYITSLTALYLWESKVGDAGIEGIVKSNPNIKILVLENAELTNDGARHIIQHLKDLKELHLERNNIDGEGKKELHEAFPSTSIALSNNPVDNGEGEKKVDA